ncbi:TetR/AcrR family transcriptional regulator [Duganella callida]|uniref:TetR/AcrR family transcriptional regulator n=1 Tax=Duganella callida TaxID=2561932 RepID=A0A4Y9SEJ7_9BURK|nr:TetR/AcrR family transcriptional regulator [Duganella callida]TFW21443.1 TetR/AcrR family transcriptional regulator [Duganella callida]
MERPRHPGRPARGTLAARRDDLLVVALDLFIRHGYAQVSLAAIAAAAHVAVRTIYVKFGGKPGLLMALIAAEQQRHQRQLEALPACADMQRQLELYAGHLTRRVRDERVMRLQAIVTADGDAAARAAWHAAGPGQLAARLEALFGQANARALFDAGLTAQDLCAHFFHCLAGHTAAGCALTPAAQDRQIERGLRLFLRGTLRDCATNGIDYGSLK